MKRVCWQQCLQHGPLQCMCSTVLLWVAVWRTVLPLHQLLWCWLLVGHACCGRQPVVYGAGGEGHVHCAMPAGQKVTERVPCCPQLAAYPGCMLSASPTRGPMQAPSQKAMPPSIIIRLFCNRSSRERVRRRSPVLNIVGMVLQCHQGDRLRRGQQVAWLWLVLGRVA